MAKHKNVHAIKDVEIDPYKPEFKRDTRGRLIMQMPGFERWMISNTPGSKIIASGAEDYTGGPSTDPASIRTGALHANTVITIGDTIKLDGVNRFISIGEKPMESNPSLIMSDEGMLGFSGRDNIFAFYIKNTNVQWRTSPAENLDKGDVIIGDINSDEFILWNDSEGKLYIKGDIIVQGDIESDGYPPGYKLEYLTGIGYFNDIRILGGDIDNVQLTGLLSGSEPSIQGWSHDMVFSATDNDTVEWTSGEIHLMDGTDYSINSGNTGNMTGGTVYYIYYSGSSTLSVTTDPETAVGSGKILICVAKANAEASKKAVFQVFGSDGQNVFITADNIASNTITANEIFANTITANEIAANTITGDEINSLYISGKYLQADYGDIAGWVMSSACLTKDKTVGSGETRIQMCIGPGSSRGHIQAAYSHNGSWTHPGNPIDLVQITQGDSSDPGGTPLPRLDIYRAEGSVSKKRVMLNSEGLYFFDENENEVGHIQGETGGSQTLFNIDDISIANNTVRILNTGVRTAWGKAFSAADNTGSLYFQMYVDTSYTSWGYQNVLSLSTSNFLKIENSGSGAIARFNGTPDGEYSLDLFGNLALYTNSSDQGNTIGAMYYNDSTNQVRVRYDTGWADIGGGAALPAGNAHDMMYCTGGTNWSSTADVYVGSRPDYKIYREGSYPNSMILYVPSNIDFAFRRGAQWAAVVDDNIWTQGDLRAEGAVEFGVSQQGRMHYSFGTIYFNKELYVTGSVRCSGFLECSTAAIKVGGKTYTPIWDFGLGKWVLGAS
jgi:hypothetical protein